MSKLIYALFFLALAGFEGEVLAEEFQDYKCYVESSYGDEYLVFFKWNKNDVSRQMMALPAKQLTDKMGKKYFVKSIDECVPVDKDFISTKAKKLDIQTSK